MKLKISDEIFERYPEIEIGIVIARNIQNGKSPKDLIDKMGDVESEARSKIDKERILEIPTIEKWREIYKSFGAKPSKFKNSVEALTKRVLRGDEIYQINTLVDIYNLISLKYIMTVGGEDLEKIEGNLQLDFAGGDEEFIPLGSSEIENPKEGEVIYFDEKGVICRCWNYREADRTKLTENTKNAVIVIENNLPERKEEHLNALEEMKGLIEKFCNARVEIKVLNKENPSEEIY